MSLQRESAPKYGVSQGALIISAAPVAGQAYVNKSLLAAGAINVAGDYECEIATDGMNVIQAELMPSAVTGSFAPSLRAMRANRASNRTVAIDTGSNFAAGVAEVLELTDLFGRSVCKVTFTVPGGGSVTFAEGTNPASPAAVAEYNGL